MSTIVVEKATITGKSDLGQDCYIFDLAPFSRADRVVPGQFVHIRVPSGAVFFRRAFSIYDVDPEKNGFRIIFKVMGRGTRALAMLGEGEKLDILGPLGNGFAFPAADETAVMIAGGIGLPPVYFLARRLLAEGIDPDRIQFFYGAVSEEALVALDEVSRLGIKVTATTDDGSNGRRGFVTEYAEAALAARDGRYRLYACGPEPMLKAVETLAGRLALPGQLSLEAPMPCGLGICLGCVRPLVRGGYTRVCRDGPVYDIGEVQL